MGSPRTPGEICPHTHTQRAPRPRLDCPPRLPPQEHPCSPLRSPPRFPRCDRASGVRCPPALGHSVPAIARRSRGLRPSTAPCESYLLIGYSKRPLPSQHSLLEARLGSARPPSRPRLELRLLIGCLQSCSRLLLTGMPLRSGLPQRVLEPRAARLAADPRPVRRWPPAPGVGSARVARAAFLPSPSPPAACGVGARGEGAARSPVRILVTQMAAGGSSLTAGS